MYSAVAHRIRSCFDVEVVHINVVCMLVHIILQYLHTMFPACVDVLLCCTTSPDVDALRSSTTHDEYAQSSTTTIRSVFFVFTVQHVVCKHSMI